MYLLFDNNNNRVNAISLHVEEDRIVLNDREHTLEKLKSRPDFRPYCKMIFPLKGSVDRTITDSFGGSHTYAHSLDPFDSYSYTAESKLSQFQIQNLLGFDNEIAFIFYPHSTNFKDAVLTISKSQNPYVPLGVTTTNSSGKTIEYVPTETIESLNPKCTIEVINETKQNNLKVSTIEFTYNDFNRNFVSCDFTATVKSTLGYVSHTKLNVTAGKARFKYIPLGVEPTEKSEIKVGIGKYTHVGNVLMV